jgi:hypothetical protein
MGMILPGPSLKPNWQLTGHARVLARYRVLTCFADSDTTVVVCLGGNKDRYQTRTGRDWYDDHVPVADRIVDHYRSKGEFR